MMADLEDTPEGQARSHRCPQCDSVVDVEARRCLMCGRALTPVRAEPEPTAAFPLRDLAPHEAVEATAASPLTDLAADDPAAEPERDVSELFVSVMRERQSRSVFLLTAVFGLLIFILATLVLRYQGPVNSLAFVPTSSPVPPSLTPTATPTPIPSETPLPTATTTMTTTPAPTATPAPERLHVLSSGQTLIGLAVIYNVSPDSIAAANGFDVDTPVQAGQSLVVPWPTPTPPLEAVIVEINGENVLADPADCPRHQIQEGQSMASIANQYGLNLDLLLRVNRLTTDTIVQPGQTVCIPEIKIGAELPPTPGPSPTPGPTQFPAGPQLLYPIEGAAVEPPEGGVMLQWAAVKDLGENERYMVEVSDLNLLDVPPYRGFTRDNAYHLPGDWRPDEPATHTLQWRVSVVQVVGERSDGQPIYQYGGRFSQPASFTWLGAVPTATPTLTATPSATPQVSE